MSKAGEAAPDLKGCGDDRGDIFKVRNFRFRDVFG